MSSNHTVHTGGMGLCSTVFVVFLILKLVGVINWSWWWVTAPLWGGLALVLGIFLMGLLFALFIAGVCWIRGKYHMWRYDRWKNSLRKR